MYLGTTATPTTTIFGRVSEVVRHAVGAKCPQNIFKQDKVNNADSAFIFFDNLKSKSMVRLVRSEKMALSGLVFARKIARMILIQNI